MSAPLVDVETGEVLVGDVALARKLEALTNATKRVRAERPGGRKEAMRRHAIGLGGDLAGERDRLVGLLDRGWVWLDAHRGASDYAAREDRWIGWLRAYTTIVDALHATEAVLR